MKILLKISLLAMTLVFATATNAQLLPVSLGLKGGINKSSYTPESYDNKSGYNVGLTLDLNLPAGFGIFTGLDLMTKGAEINETSYKLDAMYLQLPVHLGYRLRLLPGLRAHFGVGPYVAYGIGGKTKLTDGSEVDTFEKDGTNLEKLDWGVGAHVGVVLLGRIQVRAGYDMGLVDVAPKGFSTEKLKNETFYLSAGVMFF